MLTSYVTTGTILNDHIIELENHLVDAPKRVKITIEPIEKNNSKKRQFGCLKGKIKMMKNFNDPLEDFKDYM